MHLPHPLQKTCRVLLPLLLVLALPLPKISRAADAPATRPAKIFMWKAVGKSGGVAYLVGSMHLAVPDIYPLPKPMEDAFAKADTLVVEADITKLDQAAMARKIQEVGMYADNDSLSKHLSRESNAALAAFCKDNGVPAILLDKMKPWLAMITIEAMALTKAGLDPANGIDMHFLNAASDTKKKVAELESADFQLNLLASLGDQDQEKQLVGGLKEMANMPKEIAALKAAWTAGDAAKMQAIINKDSKDDPATAAFMKKLIDDRNGPMAAKIAKSIDAGETVFVVVGAAHLIGDQGIVRLLAKEGYSVTQATAP